MKTPSRSLFASLALLMLLASSIPTAQAKEYLPGIQWEKPAVVTPGEGNTQPPSDAIVLFDGTNLDAWNNGQQWKIENGVASVRKGGISTKQKFGDCQVHIEWSTPTPAKGKGQHRGNSGLFFGEYELQILDSYKSDTYFEGQAGSVYKQTPPWANAMRPPGEWNDYEVIWTAPRFNEDGTLKSPAYITALHNGVLIQNHFEVMGPTKYTDPPEYSKHGKLSIALQDHGHPVRYRNIWVREIKPPVGKRVHPPSYREGNKVTPIEDAKNDEEEKPKAA